MITLLLSLIWISPAFSAPKALPPGICPFDSAKITKNFSPQLVRDYGEAGIRVPFERRETWYGRCSEASVGSDGRFRLVYGNAQVPVRITWKAEKIEQFEFGKMSFNADSWERFSEFLAAHWPASAFFFEDAGRAQSKAARRENELLAVGEGRVVLLVDALESAIRSGKIAPGAKTKLEDRDKVQDFDDLADEESGLELSLPELKERVFQRFDRSAAEIIQRVIGTEALEAGRNAAQPFLFRREFSWLMGLPKKEMAKLKRNEARGLAKKLDRAKEMPPAPAERYDHLEKIEWLASAKELCEAMLRLREVPEVMNGLASKNFRTIYPRWKSAIYYASRDFGIAQTTVVAKQPGKEKPFCFTLLLNSHEMLDEEAGEEVLSRALGLISGVKGK